MLSKEGLTVQGSFIHVPLKKVYYGPKSCQGVSLVAQWCRTHLPTWLTQVRSLGREYPLEKEMESHSSILA